VRSKCLLDFLRNLREIWKHFKKNRSAVAALFLIVILVTVALVAPLITVYDPMEPAVGMALSPPSKEFFMGTDNLGRDVFSEVVHGSRVSLIIGFAAAFTSVFLGGVIGSISGYLGGTVDDGLMRLCDLFQSLPRFLFALVIVVFFGPTIWNVVLVIGVLGWPRSARMVRSEFLRLRESDFVLAAKAIGLTNGRIIFGQMLPNVLHILIVTGSLEVGAAILTEASLSYLGASDPNLMSWGRMLHGAQRFLRTAWWFSIFPGLAIFLTVLSLNLVGDGLNDALNPKLTHCKRK